MCGSCSIGYTGGGIERGIFSEYIFRYIICYVMYLIMQDYIKGGVAHPRLINKFESEFIVRREEKVGFDLLFDGACFSGTNRGLYRSDNGAPKPFT